MKKKNKFIVILSAEIALIIVHNILKKEPMNVENWVLEAGWHYWASLILGSYLVYFVFMYDCKKCGAAQIWRSPNILKWRWPGDKCWKCGSEQD